MDQNLDFISTFGRERMNEPALRLSPEANAHTSPSTLKLVLVRESLNRHVCAGMKKDGRVQKSAERRWRGEEVNTTPFQSKVALFSSSANDLSINVSGKTDGERESKKDRRNLTYLFMPAFQFQNTDNPASVCVHGYVSPRKDSTPLYSLPLSIALSLVTTHTHGHTHNPLPPPFPSPSPSSFSPFC